MAGRPILSFLVVAAAVLAGSCAARNTQETADSPSVVEGALATDEIGGPDFIVLSDGQRVFGRVVSESATLVVIGQRTGTYTLAKKDVKEVGRGGASPMLASLAKSERLPSFAQMLEVVSRQPWAKDFRQIPATVIDFGVVRNIPYISHESKHVEFNVYGDPEHPAGVEVGFYANKPNNAAYEALRNFMSELMSDSADRAVITSLALAEDRKERDGLTFEIAPPTAADSFGAWWLTIYDRPALERARASDEEMNQLAGDLEPTAGWPHSTYHPPMRSSGKSTRVYVRGYSRKNGTYTKPPPRGSRPR